MENASKALIIAGAILLSILIISLGIMIYNNASGVVKNSSMNQVEIQQFNQQFTQYEGKNVRGATVISMAQAVLANNMSADSDDRKVALTGNITMPKTATTVSTSNIQTGSTYTVTITYGSSSGNKGLVSSINISKN